LTRKLLPVAVVLVALAAGCAPRSREALRFTELVRVYRDCKDSVVSFSATRVETTDAAKRTRVTHTQWGSGCILTESGYILSNSHMLRFEGDRRATLANGSSCPVRTIADDPIHDLALLKIDAGRPLKPLKLGQSSKVMVGEPVVTIGNPFGISFTMASGIVSGIERGTNTEYAHLTDMVQTDASINPGSSGGPLINILGEAIALCTSNKKDAENIGFAIPIDKARALFPDMVAPEARYRFVLGLEVATNGPAAVTGVAKDSPAEAAGARVGDIVAAVGSEPVRRGIDFYLALIGRKGGEALSLKLLRKGKPIETTATLREVPLRPADKVAGLVGGLDYKHYHGRWETLPDFDKLKPTASGTVATFSLDKYEGRDAFAMKYTGYVEAPADGVYAFYVRSDDGSRLWIGDQLVVDNDGLHPSEERRGFVPLQAGKHAITVAFFEAGGEDELKVSYEGPGVKRQEIPAAALSRPTGEGKP